MTKEQILAALKKILKVALPNNHNIDKVSYNDRLFQDLGLDSISLVYIAYELEQEFHIDVAKISVKCFRTVADVVNYIDKNVNKK